NEQTALTVSQLPAHTHHVSGNTSTTGAHTHTVGKAPLDDRNFSDAGGNQTLGVVADAGGATTRNTNTGSAGNHSHSFNVTSAATGGGEPFNNLPPFYALA